MFAGNEYPKNPPLTSYSAQQEILSSIVSWGINRMDVGTAVLQLKLMHNGVVMSCCCKSG